MLPLKSGWDIIFIARPLAANADYVSLKRVVEGLLSRANLLETDEEQARLARVKAGSGGEMAV